MKLTMTINEAVVLLRKRFPNIDDIEIVGSEIASRAESEYFNHYRNRFLDAFHREHDAGNKVASIRKLYLAFPCSLRQAKLAVESWDDKTYPELMKAGRIQDFVDYLLTLD